MGVLNEKVIFEPLSDDAFKQSITLMRKSEDSNSAPTSVLLNVILAILCSMKKP